MISAIYRLTDVAKRYGEAQDGPEFELFVPQLTVNAGHRVGIVAESGFGKSTLLDLLVFASRPTAGAGFGFEIPSGGRVDVMAQWSTGGSNAFSTLRREHIGVVLQTGGLLPFLTARGNIELPGKLLGRAVDVAGLAYKLDICGQLGKYPRQLSIGQRQRVAIARALAHRPLVVVADEPTASLDRVNADRVMNYLVELAQSEGITLILASHDRTLVSRYAFEVLHHDQEVNAGEVGVRSRFWN
ncbi:MAG: ATP-binding cassette domain-containing protein [Gammaproteobacteria bacterium]|nr:ATP-binding cassette domain-containing protein [Gammaproteobacteria bacterium]